MKNVVVRSGSSLARVALTFFITMAWTGNVSVADARPPAAQAASAISSASAVVHPSVFVSLDRIPLNSQFQVAVVMEIASGFHMNSNKPSESYLIPTTLTAQLPSGFRLQQTLYPPGRLEKFSFSPDKPLSVYTGRAEIRLQIEAEGSAHPGLTTIPAVLRYQACNDTTCLQPVKLPLNIRVNVAPTGTKAQPQHRELFPALPATN